MKELPRKERTASLMIDLEYYRAGYRRIFGIDEAGRGPWAGPLVVGAVCLPLDRDDLAIVLKGVRDSKQMTHRQRTQAAEMIKATAIAWGIGEVDAHDINSLGLTQATRTASLRALQQAYQRFSLHPDFLLLDYFRLPDVLPNQQLALAKGETHSLNIAAASILAKVHRDHYMVDVAAAEFPQYGFEKHKGYGTSAHRSALVQYGVTPLHRRTYAPIAKLLEE